MPGRWLWPSSAPTPIAALTATFALVALITRLTAALALAATIVGLTVAMRRRVTAALGHRPIATRLIAALRSGRLALRARTAIGWATPAAVAAGGLFARSIAARGIGGALRVAGGRSSLLIVLVVGHVVSLCHAYRGSNAIRKLLDRLTGEPLWSVMPGCLVVLLPDPVERARRRFPLTCSRQGPPLSAWGAVFKRFDRAGGPPGSDLNRCWPKDRRPQDGGRTYRAEHRFDR